ncbi:unnamed protein product [Schistosoma mattheei]|uniref:Oxidation resistance protein 1 n=1 Tax=Schistosoma mattheei TaxID=31246 RepID=A0AA85BCP0_9TREM|nr:unnamed protein product [Schistosoma mattheei]
MEASGEFCVYEVKPGDSLSAIAAQLGFVTPTQIARANHLPLMSYGLPPVFPGQRLIIPTAARANCSSTKIKHLPGVALRIEDMDKQNVDTTNTGFLAVQPFFYTTRVLNPNKSYPIDDDALERQFVKVNAFRVLESLDNLIDGVLLVTPESLCFDASQTAVAQKQAYIASHSELSSSDYNIDATHNKMTESHHDSDNKSSTCHDNNVEFSCCHIPQELLNLGLCIPLDSIIAMKTLVENDVIHILKSECNDKINSLSNSTLQNEKTEEHVNVQSTNENTKSTDKNTDNQRNDPNLSSNIDKEQPDETSESIINDNSIGLSDSTFAVNIDEQLKTPEIPPEIETTLSTSSSVSSSPHQLPTTSLETLSTSVSQLLQKENNSEDKNVTNVTNDLYLRITLIGDITHIFRLAVDRLTQVYSFLLRAGVGSLDKHIEVNNHSEQVVIENSDKGQALDSDSKVCHRRSLVEEMLESLEQSIHVPILNGGESRILTNDMLVDLSVNFPAYWSSSNLNSIYKSEDDGYCLNTVYRKCKDVEGSVLLLIRDTMGVVFGAVMSETMKCSKHFYGTGETFVFHWKPTFKKYCWTKKNYFFMRGSLHSFHIGGQSGRNAIWFDESLKYGCSEPTDTFDNPVLSGNLPDIQFSSLSLNKSDKNENVLIENNIKNVHVNSNPLNPTIKSSSTVCDSVPFIIDTFELWQLISC